MERAANTSSSVSGPNSPSRASRANPLALSPHHKSQVVGSPVNFRKPQSLLSSPLASTGEHDKRPSAVHTLSALSYQRSALAATSLDFSANVRISNRSSSGSSSRRARPATSETAAAPSVAPLSATATLSALLATYDGSSEQLEAANQARPDSAPETRIRKPLASVAPLSAAGYAFGYLESPVMVVASPVSSSPLALTPTGPVQRQTQRCAGCGAFAEMCMGCFSRFRLQDSAAYKKQITRSVEVLFEKATARAFTKMSAVILQWLFGVWKSVTLQNRRRRATVVRVLQRQRLHRWFATWHECIYKRRVVGAMLYAENQQQVTREKSQEIALLHGEVFAVTSNASVQDHMHSDELAKLQQLCAAQADVVVAKNQELVALRRELQDVKDRLVVLEKQAIDPRELERIKNDSVDYKKVAFQLATAMCQTMEAQMEQLAASEGRHNLSHTFTKETLQTLDKPECQAFYNPLVELDSAAVAAANSAPTASSSANGASSSADSSSSATTAAASFFASYDAPTDRAEKILIQWVNTLVQRHGLEWLPVPRMLNFHSSLADGKLLVVLTKILHQAMCKVRPKRPSGAVSSKLEATSVLRENGEDLTEIAMERYVEHMRREENPEKRLELMITTLGQALWLPVGLLNAKDILAGDAEFNFAALTYLFATFSPCQEESFHALCNDLKLQLSSAKAKWRELREGASAAPVPSTETPHAIISSSSDSLKRNRGRTGSSGTSGKDSKDDTGEDSALSSKMKLALAHTMELKRKIDLEDQKAREGHVLWWKSIRIVLRKCFLSYARLARGKAGVLTRLDAAGDENEAFSKVPKHKIQDLELPFEDFAWEIKLLQSFLLTVHCDLARIYRGYANRNGVANEFITVGDFLELLTECRVLDAHLTTVDVNAMLKKIDPKQVRYCVCVVAPRWSSESCCCC